MEELLQLKETKRNKETKTKQTKTHKWHPTGSTIPTQTPIPHTVIKLVLTVPFYLC